MQDGLQDAKKMLIVLNMTPPLDSGNNSWFLTPWVLKSDDLHFFAYILMARLVRGEDGDAKVLRHDLEATVAAETRVDNHSSHSFEAKDDIVEDGSPTFAILDF